MRGIFQDENARHLKSEFLQLLKGMKGFYE
jgi:hypothetical protein